MTARAPLLALALLAAGCSGGDTPPGPPVATQPPQATTTGPPTTAAAVRCLHLGVPAYVEPSELRRAATQPAMRYLVLNPANGPDLEPDPELARVVRDVRRDGVAVLGYVHTRYTDRPLAEVADDVARYRQWYEIDGIFVDEVSATAAELPYYRELAAVIRGGAGDVVALNPGTYTDAGYFAVADLVVTFEDDWEAYADLDVPDDVPAGPAEQWHLVLGAGEGEMLRAIDLALQRGATVLDVTDAGLGETWNRLPSHLAAQAVAVNRLNQANGCGP